MESTDKLMAIFIVSIFLCVTICTVIPFILNYKSEKTKLESKQIELKLKQIEVYGEEMNYAE